MSKPILQSVTRKIEPVKTSTGQTTGLTSVNNLLAIGAILALLIIGALFK
ncbi:MAG TPA: hypothetical protein PK131_01015 [Candidatus Woesebacteria bacterium]|nr:hypothetical protein [Candidatus Woesebacteria bacterium]HRS22691.1 hypothetical protein [Candidatus Woesebacteria bacterium]